MSKKEREYLIKEITRMLKDCEDVEMIHLVYVLLLNNRY